MTATRRWAACTLLAVSVCVAANSDPDPSCKPAARVVLNGDEIRLEAHDAPLNRVLDLIASNAGVRIHAVAIPEPRISTICGGTALEQIVACVFGPDADFVTAAVAGHGKSGSARPGDVWVLGANRWLHNVPAAAREDAACSDVKRPPWTRPQTLERAAPRTLIPPPDVEETAALLEMATAQESWRRIQALTRLGSARQGGDERVRETLTSALTDPDPDVRAQAVAGLARTGDGDQAALLHDAMRDNHSSVRMMAVGIVSNDAHGEALLREALADSDPAVQELAAMKLEALFAPRQADEGTN